ncbi:MAG TPA: tetratricopeptide repeat protein [Lacunisphaera sp.]|nr:tetratricopeptide repeat protein [Lacunisphaera sp.]
MKPTSSPTRLTGRHAWVIGFIAALAVAAAAWPLVRNARLVRAGLPARPADTGLSPALADALTAADVAARNWRPSSAALAQLAGLYHANGFASEALACYRVLAAFEPREPRWPHLLAHLESSFGRLDAALPWQRSAVALAPDDFAVHLRLGDLLFKQNAVAGAEQAYARAAQVQPANPYALLGLARCAQRREDWRAAREHLRAAVTGEPGFVSGWALLASIETRLGNDTAAAEARRRGNGQFREYADPWLAFLDELSYDPYQLSVAAAVSPDPARARQLLERAIALAPDVASYRRQLAKLVATSEPATARAELERAVRLAPDDAESWSALVALLLELKDSRAALAALAEGLRHCPQSGFLHFTNGRRLAATGQTAAAEAEFKVSQRLQPAEIRGYIELSALYVRTGRMADAAREATAALAMDPGNSLVLGMLAQLAIIQEDEPAALAWVAKIRALPSDESATLRQVAAMFEQQFSRPLPQ